MGHNLSRACSLRCTELMWGFGRIKTRYPQGEANLPPMSMETTMHKTAPTIFGALLMLGSVVQMAAASEHHHHLSKASFGRHLSEYRGAYNQVNQPINVSVTRLAPDRFDPSTPHSEDPALNPAGE
jgi:hypothetical protein